MPFLPATARGVLPLACAVLLVGTSAAAETIDLYGVESATLGWAPASGPVAGYYVVVARNGGPPSVDSFATEPQASVSAAFGDEIVVYVTAYDTSGVAGPISPPSPTLRFNDELSDPPPDDPGEPTGDPPTDPPPDDPPPDDPPGDPLRTALDFDGDGNSDLLVRDPTGELELWRMDGSKALSVDPLDYLPPSWNIVGNGDYDGNGVADVLWEESPTGSLVVWLMADGAIEKGSILSLPGLLAEHDWHVGGSGDFDGDGSDDVMLFSRVLGETELVYLANGETDVRERLPGYTGAFSVEATVDVDGDDVDEIVWRDETQHALILWDLDTVGPEAPLPLAETIGDWRTVGSGDFDGDGRADLFVSSRVSDHVQVWRLEDDRIAETIDLPPSAGRSAAGVGDYDLDGRADLVWLDTAASEVEIWFSDGGAVQIETVTGGSETPGELVSGADGSDDAAFLTRLCDADFDGDGMVGARDFSALTGCVGSGNAVCGPMDLDSDGSVGATDFAIFQTLFGAPVCAP